MIINVKGSSGQEYTVDTEALTCTCKHFRFRCSRRDKLDPERLCKHLTEVFDKNPHLKPSDLAIEELKREKTIEEISKHSGYPRVLVETYVPFIITAFPNISLKVIGDYAKGKEFVDSLEFLTQDELPSTQQIESMQFVGVSNVTETPRSFMLDNILKVTLIREVGAKYYTRLLFGTSEDYVLNRLLKLAENKGLILTPSQGLLKADATEESIEVTSLEDLISIIES